MISSDGNRVFPKPLFNAITVQCVILLLILIEAALIYVFQTEIAGASGEILRLLLLLLPIATICLVMRHAQYEDTDRIVTSQTTAKDYARIIQQHFDAWHLTVSEKDVALYIIKGFSNREIATFRGSTEATVKSQINAIFRKSKLSTRHQLISLLIEEFVNFVDLSRIERPESENAPETVPKTMHDSANQTERQTQRASM